MKGTLIIPAMAAMLAWPVSAEASDGISAQSRSQIRVSAERPSAAPQRRAVQRRAVQRLTIVRRTAEDSATVRRRAARLEHRRIVHNRPDDPTKREIFHQFKRKLYARAHNAIENGASPERVRRAVQAAIRKAIARLKASG